MIVGGDWHDHEHPCPSSACIDRLRGVSYEIPAGTDCCVCYLRSQGMWDKTRCADRPEQ